jgi:hypothetical protein
MPKLTDTQLENIHTKLLSIGQECVRIINTQPKCAFLVMVGKFPSAGWPRGHCIGSDSRGRFYSYDAKRVLAKIVSLGVMTVECKVRGEE